MNTLTEVSPEQTFELFAPFYDRFTAHYDYDDWMITLEGLAREHGLRGSRLLDIACGTGKSFLPLIERGYSVTGCDFSQTMLDQARAKAGPDVELLLADMTDLPRLGEFDLATSMGEPVNYLATSEEVAAAFAGVRRNLRPGGIYVFDVNSRWAYESLFASDICYEREGWFFVWRGQAQSFEPGAEARATIEAFQQREGGGWDRYSDLHVQRHYPLEDVKQLLLGAGLEPIAIYGQSPDATTRDPDEGRHMKLIFMAKRL